MRSGNSTWLAVVPFSLAFAVFVGLAPTMLNKSDNFNNSALAGFACGLVRD